MPKKFERDKDTKIAGVMESFLRLVEGRGFSAIKIADIANAAGVSVGTVYRYFPKGKQSMMRFLLEGHFSDIADFGDFRDMNEANIDTAMESMIGRHITEHQKNMSTHIAINQAILADRELLAEYNAQLSDLFSNLAPKLQEVNPILKDLPQEAFLEKLLLIFDIMEAVVHRHLFIRRIRPTDGEVVDFLKGIILDQVLRP